MTTEERIKSVERFGYSTREAGFLVLAALHSGYFLRRQYCAYLGVGFGYPDDALTSKLLRLGHAREVSLRYGRRLYRIHSKPIFAALGDVDNRNRRVHNPETIQARLMGLDYPRAEQARRHLVSDGNGPRLAVYGSAGDRHGTSADAPLRIQERGAPNVPILR